MADYRQEYAGIRLAGANVAAVSVDPPETSQALRIQLSLPFPILCDTGRSVIKEWDLYNARERGGIAKPAVFVIGSGRVVRYAALETVASRVPARDILRLLQTDAERSRPRSRLRMPLLSDWFIAIRNGIRSARKRSG